MEKNQTLEAVEKVDQMYAHSADQALRFYNESFNHLMSYVGWTGAIVVVLISVILPFINFRIIKKIRSDNAAQMKMLKNELDEKLNNEIEKFRNDYKKEKEKIESDVNKIESDLKRDSSILMAEISSLQAKTSDDKNLRIRWSSLAALKFLRAKEFGSLEIELESIQNLIKLSSHDKKEIYESIKLLFDELQKFSDGNNGMYHNHLKNLEELIR